MVLADGLPKQRPGRPQILLPGLLEHSGQIDDPIGVQPTLNDRSPGRRASAIGKRGLQLRVDSDVGRPLLMALLSDALCDIQWPELDANTCHSEDDNESIGA